MENNYNVTLVYNHNRNQSFSITITAMDEIDAYEIANKSFTDCIVVDVYNLDEGWGLDLY